MQESMRHTKALVDQLIFELSDISAKLESDELTASRLCGALDSCMNLFRATLIGGYQLAEPKTNTEC